MPDNRPIGVFDSGVGGLTVLQALREQLPAESTIYLGDLARCPYGTRPQSEVRRFAVQIADLLAGEGIKLLVVACNTATAAAIDELRRRYSFPVVGVIEPGSREALRITRRKRIGVVATQGTVSSGAYRAVIRHMDPEAVVIERPASWLVPMIERGPLIRAAVPIRLKPLLVELRAHAPDVLILGCTHFPLVRDTFEQEIGPGITVVDSAVTTAAEVARLVRDLDLGAWGPPRHRLLVTGPAEAFTARAGAMFSAVPLIETIGLELDAVS